MTTNKYLREVQLNADVYAMCLQHALSTEKEEIMGILIGNVDEDREISQISALRILHRIDKQPDRVEILPQQLVSASNYAEQLSEELGRNMRVIGWYHSHPHITVWPSHVDVRTQYSYQSMDSYFIGLIFAVFPHASGSTAVGNNVELTAFQSMGTPGNLSRREIPIRIVNSPINYYNMKALATLPKILLREESDTADKADVMENDFLNQLHNEAYKTISHLHIINKLTEPLCHGLNERLRANEERIKALESMKESLIQKVKEFKVNKKEEC